MHRFLRQSVFAAVSCSVFLFASAAVADGHGAAIQVPRDVPFERNDVIPEKIKNECTTLGEKLGTFIHQYAGKHGVDTVLVDRVDPKARGRVLVVEITNAVSAGNAFIGHQKQVSARAELFENGVSKGDVSFTRSSGGGFMGGYKGSCSVLGRCAKTLGSDIAKWLKGR